MGREGIRFLTVALVGVSSLGSPAQEEKLDAQALHGRDRAALLNVRTVLLAEKQFAARTGALYGPFECLTKPETCLPDFPKEDAPFLDPTYAWLETRLGYERQFHPGPKATEDELRRAKAVPDSLKSFAFTAVPVKPGETGLRAYCGDATGKICFTADGAPPGIRAGRCVPPCEALK
jgi:hypothetical protein